MSHVWSGLSFFFEGVPFQKAVLVVVCFFWKANPALFCGVLHREVFSSLLHKIQRLQRRSDLVNELCVRCNLRELTLDATTANLGLGKGQKGKVCWGRKKKKDPGKFGVVEVLGEAKDGPVEFFFFLCVACLVEKRPPMLVVFACWETV